MQRRIISLLLALAMLTFCVACSSEQPAQEAPATPEPAASAPEPEAPAVSSKKKIGFSVITSQFPPYVAMQNSIKAECEKKGWDCVMAEAGMSVEKTMNDCLDLLTQGIDALLIASWYGDSFGEVFAKAAELNIPIFMIDTGGVPDTGYVTHIGIDDFAAGKAQGDWVAGYFLKKGVSEINCIGLTSATTIGRNRLDGILAGLKEHPGVTVNVLQEYLNDSREGFMNDVEDALTTYSKIDYIIGANGAEGALAAYDACQAAQRQEVCISGFNNEAEEKALVEKGENYICNLDNQLGEMGRIAVQCAEEYFNGATFEIRTKSPILLYTVDGIVNVDY